ncbi:hypothetical protein ACMD2_06569 [Ananas comosus]|uniref:Uncharacterized protein n=1 Tax=Ananas comosus TaxID=4615 RepID=A0A199UYY6_ANACO|nr:hypothetical protein ACMD2_06569 [Ananas comosus]
MLLRGWRSLTGISTTAAAAATTIIATTAKTPGISILGAAATTTTTTTTLLLNPHHHRFLSPWGIGRGGATTAAFRSAAFCTAPSPGNREGMENKEKNDENSHGEDDDNHKKKSDEEGFGGIYGRSDDATEDHEHHANHPEYDKTQGSEVKEKEKARNLPDDAAATGHAHDQGAAAAEKS